MGRSSQPHTQEDRLATLARVRRAGMRICSGGIIGMGESIDDRCAMLATLARLDPHPESVPINAAGAHRGHASRQPAFGESAATGARDRHGSHHHAALAGATLGRSRALTREAQVMCFVAGANSIFYGEKLLTTGNPDVEADQQLLRDAGLRPAPPGH